MNGTSLQRTTRQSPFGQVCLLTMVPAGLTNFSDGFSADQTYALIVLADGGEDLESFKFDRSTGWIQAQSVFWQIVGALAQAEQFFGFEVSCVPQQKSSELIVAPRLARGTDSHHAGTCQH